MIKQITEGVATLAPFLADYPPWVKFLFVTWVGLSATLLVSLILARPSQATTGASSTTGTGNGKSPAPVWLEIKGVELFGTSSGGKVKVTAKINGVEYRYPSLEGVEWMEVGPEMSHQQFRVPRARDDYQVRFVMTLRSHGHDYEMVSQQTDYVRTLPHEGLYSLYRVGEERTRSAGIEAEVKYALHE